MSESELPWRMSGGQVFPVDSIYLHEEIQAKALELLHAAGFEGALHEFRQARDDLTNRDTKAAIRNANLAVESAIKGILSSDRSLPGRLYRTIIDSGLFPEYFEGFLKAFEEIVRGVATMRNQEPGVGHGQGRDVNEVPYELAEFAVNLAGLLVKFAVDRHLATSDG